MSVEPKRKWWMPQSRNRVLAALAWIGVASTAWLMLLVPRAALDNSFLELAQFVALFSAPAIAIGTFFGGARLAAVAGIIGLILGSVILTIAGSYAVRSH
jgi:hypothetical protein